MVNNISAFLDIRKREGQRTLLVVGLFLLVGVLSFVLGRLSVESSSQQRGLIVHTTDASASAFRGATTGGQGSQATPSQSGAIEGGVVASKSGTKYHFPWCAGAKSIKETNKIWFKTIEEARNRGYTPASNCKGLQ